MALWLGIVSFYGVFAMWCPRFVHEKARVEDIICGTQLCPQTWLSRLVSHLYHRKGNECQAFVSYSAAFRYSRSFSKLAMIEAATTSQLISTHGHCFFRFVLSGDNHTASDSFEHIALNASSLPYAQMRRNVKLFKLLGHLIFHWTKRLVWIDAKIRHGTQDPVDFATQMPACASFVGLPFHPNAFEHRAPSFSAHALTLTSAKRNLTDSMQALQSQVDYYLREVDDHALSQALIDSAFFVRDLSDQGCRDFNARLGIAWYYQIECFSDRDQISFPFVLVASLKLVRHAPPFPANSTWWTDQTRPDMPLVRIAPPGSPTDSHTSLHWYYSHRLAVGKCLTCQRRIRKARLAAQRARTLPSARRRLET